MAAPKLIRLIPTVTNGAYGANDVVGGLLAFTGAPDKGMIVSVTIVDLAKQAGAYILALFDSAPTTIADNQPYDIADADMNKLVGAIYITDTAGADKFDFTDTKLYCRQGLVLPYRLTGTATLYGFLIALGTPTLTSTADVQIQLGIDG